MRPPSPSVARRLATLGRRAQSLRDTKDYRVIGFVEGVGYPTHSQFNLLFIWMFSLCMVPQTPSVTERSCPLTARASTETDAGKTAEKPINQTLRCDPTAFWVCTSGLVAARIMTPALVSNHPFAKGADSKFVRAHH